tara:strand:+ start:61693 stop:63621 length:1929 start_codon:yes stop_codon:yes gene_type:complete
MWICILLFLSVLASADLYQQDSLDLVLNINGDFDLIASGDAPKVKDVSSEILLFPDNDFRQQVVEFDTKGTKEGESVKFFWDDNKLGKKEFGYSTLVRTVNTQNVVQEKLAFPIAQQDLKGYEQYLEPTITIDSTNPEVINQATELVQGEDDLFRVAFILASWVESNVKYDLNTVTAKASKKASWVLENKEGVCDEMTSLFVAMARSVGIPARFASGISYSSSDLFDEPWQPHGWAEVYFPDIGWVSFDITFGEYGYVDVTHIKLRDSFDPAEPATKFQWLANNVELKSQNLELDVKIAKEGENIDENIKITQDLLSNEVGFGSYNVVKGFIKNTANYYTATTVKLAAPPEIEIEGRNQRTILLPPLERRETLWILKIPEDLEKGYIYSFPLMIYSERNSTDIRNLEVKQESKKYTREETLRFADQDEEKTYSSKISLDCDFSESVHLNEENTIICQVHNQGNSNLNNLKLCIGESCEVKSVKINQKESLKTEIKGEKIGWIKLIASVENGELQKKEQIEFKVLDKPEIVAEITAPKLVNYGEKIKISFILKKNSFVEPKNIYASISGPGFSQDWELSNLPDEKELNFELKDYPLQSENKFTLKLSWDDKFSSEEDFIIHGEAKTFTDKVKMFFNRILNLLK